MTIIIISYNRTIDHYGILLFRSENHQENYLKSKTKATKSQNWKDVFMAQYGWTNRSPRKARRKYVK